MEHVAGANDIALADFNRRRMHHRPGGFGSGAGKYALAAGQGRFIAGGAVGFTSLKDKGGLAVEAYVFGIGFRAAQVSEEREGDGRYGRWSRRRRPAEIGKGTDYIEVAVFTGDFIECHSGRKTKRKGYWVGRSSENIVRWFQTTFLHFIFYTLSLAE